MKSDALSLRQVMVLLFTALLVPAVDLLPALAAKTSGGGGWMLPLGALPLLLVALWARDGIPFGEKRGAYTIIYIMYMLLILLLLTVALKLCALRLGQIYGDGPALPAAIALLAAAVWMGWGKPAAFARAGEIFYLAIAVVLAGVVALGIFQVEPGNLAVSAAQAGTIPRGSLLTAGIILNVYPACVLGNQVKGDRNNGRRAVGWTVAYCVAAALILVAVIGCIGPALAGELPSPFLIVVQGIGIDGAFQRTEALVATLWTLSDFVLMGLLLHSWRGFARQLRPGRWEKWSMCAAAVAAAAAGFFLLSDSEVFRRFCAAVLPVTGIVFGLVFPLFLKAIHVIGRRGKCR